MGTLACAAAPQWDGVGAFPAKASTLASAMSELWSRLGMRPKTMRRWLLLLVLGVICLITAACVSQPPHDYVSGSLPGRHLTDHGKECYQDDDTPEERIAKCRAALHLEESVAIPHPSIGIALSGGGSRSAAYSMGVLQGLWQGGILYNADYVSSVSGGSYSAYFLYSHLIAQQSAKNLPVGIPDDWFRDCMPVKYKHISLPNTADASTQIHLPLCPEGEDNYIDATDAKSPRDPYRYQSYLRGNQSILTGHCNYHETTLSSNIRPYTYLGLLTLAQMGEYILVNDIFDERAPISFTRAAYLHGIGATYGAVPDVLDGTEGLNKCRGRDEATELTKLTFMDLRGLLTGPSLALCPPNATSACAGPGRTIPSWIVNTTDSSSGRIFDSWTNPSDEPHDRSRKIGDLYLVNLRYSVFELSAYDIGSDQYGYLPIEPAPPGVGDGAKQGVNEDEKPLSILHVTEASGAFMDPQEREYGNSARASFAALLYLFGVVWGEDIGNYNIDGSSYQKERNIHSLEPAPIYFIKHFRRDGKSLYIHLSDGGQSDNTGIFSLLRRGVKTIIFADAGQDVVGTFEDLCKLKAHLKAGDLYGQPFELELDDHYFGGRKFEDFCDGRMSIDLANWPYPVMRGKIYSDSKDQKGSYAVDLFVLKPSLDLQGKITDAHDEILLGDFVKACQRANQNDPYTAGCIKMASSIQCNAADYHGMPCEVIGFLADQNTSSKCESISFPQNKTVNITEHSSFTLYGAYRELGRFAASQLLLSTDGSVNERDSLHNSLDGQEIQGGMPLAKANQAQGPNCLFGVNGKRNWTE
jgi:hypothetical protein